MEGPHSLGRVLMVNRFFEPAGFSLVLFALFWFAERHNSRGQKVDRTRLRLWLGLCTAIMCGEYAVAWHTEISLAWQNYPDLTLFLTVAVIAAVRALLGPLPKQLS